ncbi:MAG TPA: glycosyltransferase family 4 protein [Tepidisphaeraceae bacterium]|nr:glycosyltransferase family 4 protein [Tepidisphaeraceae bacterium]
MEKPTLYFFTPDLPHVLGGIKQIYRHVAVLNANGFDAWVVHRKKGFKVNWFEHNTRVMYEPAPLRKNFDIAVFPEIWGPKINGWGKDIRKVIFNQNAYYTWMSQPLKGPFDPPYLNPQVMATIVVSEDNRKFLKCVFPRMPIYRIRYSINPKLYYPQPKKRQICVMPRKNIEDVKQVLHILRLHRALEGWKVVLIDKFTEAQTAAVMRESAIFLNFGSPEGFGLPAAEAMACGCIVIGYDGFAGREFMDEGRAYIVPLGDILRFVGLARSVMKEWEADPQRFEARLASARRLITEEYSPERESGDIVGCWNEILRIAQEKQQTRPDVAAA